jgi:PAS domain S-box-containing protein
VEGIFQVTPDGRYLSVNPALVRIHGFSSQEEMMASVTDIAHQLYVDPSRRAELRRLMAENGFVKDFEILMRKKDSSLQWVSVTSHAVKGNNGETLYYEGMLIDITTRKLAEEEARQLKKILNSTIETICPALEMKDYGTKGHQKGVSRLARAIAEEMGPQGYDRHYRYGRYDTLFRELAVPSEILVKPEKITEVEYNLIKTHPQAGYDMLKEAGLPGPIGDIILQHHERLDVFRIPKGSEGCRHHTRGENTCYCRCGGGHAITEAI